MKLAAALFLALVSLTAVAQPGSAQSFPSKPIRVVVPFPAGGTTDIVARLVGQRMSESMGQPVLVENKGGAGGQIGAADVAKSPPDGYSVLIHNVTFPMASVAAALQNRAMVQAAELGTPLQIEANFLQDKFLLLPLDNWRLSPKEAPAGPMTATGIHLLDLSVGVMGIAERVFASVDTLGSQLTNGDTLGILVRFKGGGNALLGAVLATPFDGRFAVYGSRGWAEVRDKAHPESPRGWTLTTHMRGGEKQTRDYPPAKAVLANLEGFADAAAGRAPYPVPQAEMIANVSALEAIFRSAASGKVEAVDNG